MEDRISASASRGVASDSTEERAVFSYYQRLPKSNDGEQVLCTRKRDHCTECEARSNIQLTLSEGRL